MDMDYDTADAAHDLIRATTGAQKVAVRALMDLPPDYPIGLVTAMNGEVVRVIIAGNARTAVVHGEMDPDMVLDLLVESGSIRPTEGVA